jgi:hypothetical protein
MIKSNLESIESTLEKHTAPEKLELIEHLARSLRTMPATRSGEQQLEALKELRKEMAALPIANPTDGFAGRDTIGCSTENSDDLC